MNEMAGSIGGGAAQGAALGTMVAPGFGTLVGAGVGAIGGLVGGMASKKAKKAKEAAIAEEEAAMRREMVRRGEGVAAVRQQFGDIASMGQHFNGGVGPGAAIDPSRFQDANKTLLAHSQIAGGIENEAGAVRDAGTQQLTDTAQGSKAQVEGSLASRGLLGSSLDTSAKQMLLSQYAGGRADVAGGTEAVRQGGWDVNKNTQMAFEDVANQGSNVGDLLRSTGQTSAIQGATGQIPYTLFGNLLNTGLGVATNATAASAQGGSGLSTVGINDASLRPRTQRNYAAGGSTSGKA